MVKIRKVLCTFLPVLLIVAQLPVNNVLAVSANESKTIAEQKEEKLKQYLEETKSKNDNGIRPFSATSEKTMIENDYLEFMVDDNGRFTIGNVEGNPDYTSDNKEILLFGHPDPGTSFSTIRIQSNEYETKDIKFSADTNEYDTENKTVTSIMNIDGSFENGEIYSFIVTQYLEFVSGSHGTDDTVKINYTIKNNGINTQKAGIRIMLDTMLADNDDAPFKVLGYGNVTSELELHGNSLPSTYQVYDNLDNPTTFATGTLYLENDRIPDKVQFARWDYIEDTFYNYETTNKRFGDSAVAIYFNPINIEPTKNTSMCTYYGVNSNLTSDAGGETVDSIDESQYGVLVYDSLSQDYISGAEVTINGTSVITDENGLAVFENYKDNNGKAVNVKVSKDGYKITEVPRNILCGSFTGVGIVSENSTSQEPSVLSAVMQSGTNMYDLLTSYVYYDEADGEDKKDGSILIRVSNAGTANTYRLVQAGQVKYESTDGTFTIPIVTKDKNGNDYDKPRIIGLSAGQDVKLEMINSGFGIKSTSLLGLKISTPTFKTAAGKKGSISIGDKINFTIPESVPFFGNAKVDFGIMNPLPLTIKAENGGKFKIAIGKDLNDTDSSDKWDKFKKDYNKMLEDIKHISKYNEVANAFGTGNFIKDTYGAGSLKFKCNLTGYGEGVADSNGNLNIELGIILTLQEKGTYTQYFFLTAVPVYLTFGETGEIVTQIKGNLVYGDNNFSFVGGDCTIEPSFSLSVEGGVGVKGALSVSAEGNAKIKWLHRFTNNYNRVSLSGAIAVKLKLLLFEAQKSFDSPELTIWETDANNRQATKNLRGLCENNNFELSKRINSGVETYSANNFSLEAMYTDIKEVTVNGTSYRFYLADDIDRTDENRTTIVFQKYKDGQWTVPVPIDNDKTADLNFSIATDNNNIYVVWENMCKEFDETVTLSDMIKSCQISLCKIETDNNDTVTKLFTSTDDKKGDFSPSITIASDNKVKIVWYSNSNNYIYGNTDVEKGKDSIYYAEIPLDGTLDNIKQGNILIESGNVMSLATGRLNGEDIIIYSVDEDGDFNTENDIVLYADTAQKPEVLINKDTINTNAKFATLDGKEVVFYYSSGNIAYITEKASDISYVFDIEEIPLGISDNFSIISNENGSKCSILWKNSNDGNNKDIYAVNYQNNKWSKPYILTTVNGEDVSIPSGYIDSDGKFNLFYGYNDESGAVIKTESIECVTDISLDNVSINHESVKPGSGLDFDIIASNTGHKDVDSISIKIYKNDEIVKEQNMSIDLGIGVTSSYKVTSAFIVPDNLNEVTDYKIEILANDEENKSDNSKIISIGYTDISIQDNGRYMVSGNEYIALKVNNTSNFDAKNVRIRVFADSMDGTVIYDNYIENMEAATENIYNININQLSNSRVAYAVVSCDSLEFYSYNNTDLLAINPYLKRAEKETYNLTISSQEGGKIISGDSGNYVAGTEISLKAEANSGYRFEGWASEAGNFLNALDSETIFIMPAQETSIIAKFVKEQKEYKFVVEAQEGGSIISDISGNCKAGDKIPIEAKVNTGYNFIGWEAENGIFENSKLLKTNFIMPEQDVTIKAKFQKNIVDNYGGGGSSGGYIPGPVVTDPVIVPSSVPTLSPSQMPSLSPRPSATTVTTSIPDQTQVPVITPEITPTPLPIPEFSQTPEATLTPSASPVVGENNNTSSLAKLKKGSKVKDKKTKAVYKIISTGKNKTAEYVKSTKKNTADIVIPASVKLKGKTFKVVSIEKGAFKNNKKLKSVKIGKNVKAIAKEAFSGCKKLVKVKMGKNINSIGAKAFSNCTSLTIITIPSKVKKIGKKAFYKCKNLRYIDVKTKKLKPGSIGSNAFGDGYRNPRIKMDKSVWMQYQNILESKGLSNKAVFIVNPDKLVI